MASPGRRRKRAKKPKGRKLSVMVIHRTEDAMELTAAVKSWKKKVAAAISERYSPGLRPGEVLPDYVLALELAVRDVKTALRRLIELDDAVDHATVDHEMLRRERNRLVAQELYPRAVTVRGSIDLAFGREHGGWAHHMKGRTERKGPALARQLRLLVSWLTNPERKLPPPKNPHAFVDREHWRRQIEGPYRQLVKLNQRVGLGSKKVVGLVGDKQAAMEAFDTAYGDALRFVTAALAMAGFDARLIKKLKPYYQRRRLAKRARNARQARAAAATIKAVPEEIRPAAEKTARVTVPKTVARWLEKNRLFGT